MQKIILSSSAPAPIGPYSQAVEANGFIFCSGQIPLDAAGNVVPGDSKAQAEQIMKNINAVLTAAGVGFRNVVKTNIFLTDMKDFASVNEVYGRFFPENPPARSTIQVAALPKGVQVEIEVTAIR
jgi:2-iminobutanoate/2-iminopropanoate deaminase